MHNEHHFPQGNGILDRVSVDARVNLDHPLAQFSRQAPIGVLLIAALLAFEVFNFDTTRFALLNLMGEVNFVGLRWASILALAFCAIDFAGLAHLFAPWRGAENSGESWYLMGAWLLGATMNALMTWWAVNLTLLNHELGNEILTREQLLTVVPPFVAVLVWLTRILFIGAFSVAGSTFFQAVVSEDDASDYPRATARTWSDESELRRMPEGPQRPLRDPGRAAPTYVGGAYRPISRAPRSAPTGLSARSRQRD